MKEIIYSCKSKFILFFLASHLNEKSVQHEWENAKKTGAKCWVEFKVKKSLKKNRNFLDFLRSLFLQFLTHALQSALFWTWLSSRHSWRQWASLAEPQSTTLSAVRLLAEGPQSTLLLGQTFSGRLVYVKTRFTHFPLYFSSSLFRSFSRQTRQLTLFTFQQKNKTKNKTQSWKAQFVLLNSLQWCCHSR